ncbi:hypothetical protein [Chitinolyticbacter albus]|uniref:hypothetical protein n=1 Tax=Chitinolyticbacter albus TaxID=2961951 RepID=UPI00210DF6A4|nr:hypothetical protein [Chitinolyticbacter albus]
MDAKEAIDRFRDDLTAVKKGGRKTVRIEAVEKYLQELEQESGVSLELRKLEMQQTLAHFDAVTQSGFEMFRAVIEAGKEALNSALLVNGGAVIAILSFLSASAAKEGTGKLGQALTVSLLLFGCGVLLTAVAFGGRYVTQLLYQHEAQKSAIAAHIFTVLLGLGSYAAFSCGVYRAYLALSVHFGALL